MRVNKREKSGQFCHFLQRDQRLAVEKYQVESEIFQETPARFILEAEAFREVSLFIGQKFISSLGQVEQVLGGRFLGSEKGNPKKEIVIRLQSRARK